MNAAEKHSENSTVGAAMMVTFILNKACQKITIFNCD